MGIRVDFLIKHVRPYGMDAWRTICEPTGRGSLSYWLLTNGVTDEEVIMAFAAWRELAQLEINSANMPQFIAAANTISQDRWNQLYPTNYSTILFLNDPLIKQLSFESSRYRNQQLDFDPPEHIPLAVTINHLGQPPATIPNAYGARVQTDSDGNCFHFNQLFQGENTMNTMTTPSSEAVRRFNRSAALAQQTLKNAGKQGSIQRVHQFFGISPKLDANPTRLALDAGAPDKNDLDARLKAAGTAPGATSIVTVPAAPVSGDIALVQNVQTLDSYIALITALVMYQNHPTMYDLSNKRQAAQFVIDLANTRNSVLSGRVGSIPAYLPMGEATTQSFNKSTTTVDLHVDLLNALFGALSLPSSVLSELDGILTEIASSLANLQLSFTTQTQTLNHFVSFYYLTPVPGSNPPINQMNVEFIYLQLDQSSWQASVSAGKSSSTVSNFTLNMTTTRTTATMSAGIVAADTQKIVNTIENLTSAQDADTISKWTQMKGVQT